MRARLCWCLLLAGGLIGCSGSATDVPTAEGPAGVAVSNGDVSSPAAARPAPQADDSTRMDQGISEEPTSLPPLPTMPPEPSVSPEPAVTPQPDVDRVKADVGVGAKGRGLDKLQPGVLVTPAKAYFTMREKAIFQIQIPSAMQLYEGLHGSAPRTHEQFMTEIIQANQIKLPDLPPGQSYLYDPEAKELMVQRPKH
jgi:hypothetical protein